MVSVVTTGTYLDRILANTAAEVAVRKAHVSVATLEQEAASRPAALPMAAVLRGQRVRIITEIKRASPSKGEIAPGVAAIDVAQDYLAAGAGAISVLTDERFFGGSLQDLRAVSNLAHADAWPRPVLRKDFVVDQYQVLEARAAGADAVLLIVAALTDPHLKELLTCANELGLSALVEVHDEWELERALSAGASFIGVNNRDLRSFGVDLATTERLAPLVPESATLVGESGVASRADVERLERAGVHAVLVGETLMRATDRRAAVQELLG